MKFVCLGYIDESQWQALPEAKGMKMMETCMNYDDELRRGGHFIGGEALDSAKNAVTLRTRNGKVEVTDGPFSETKEVLGGILLLEARDLNHAIALMSAHPGVGMGPFEIRPADIYVNQLIAEREMAARAESAEQTDEKVIRDMMKSWSNALEAKDLDGLCAYYTEKTVLYDAIPPYKTVGADNIRQLWNSCFPYFPDTFRSEHKDLSIHVSGETAFVYGIHHFVTTPADHPAGQTWMRITVCLEKQHGMWRTLHEHVSIPFNPMNNHAWQIKDPENINQPDYNQSNQSE